MRLWDSDDVLLHHDLTKTGRNWVAEVLKVNVQNSPLGVDAVQCIHVCQLMSSARWVAGGGTFGRWTCDKR